MSDCRLKFKECVDCKEWNGNRTHCANICSKPYAAWDGFNRYMELEEQGLLIRLPVPIGVSVYILDYTFECKLDYKCDDPCEFKCNDDIFCEHEYKKYRIREAKFKYEMLEYIGKTAFLTREEAEAALERMG